MAFRGIGGSYTESTGVVNPVTEPQAILGGTSDTDRVLSKSQGDVNDIRSVYDGMKAKAAFSDIKIKSFDVVEEASLVTRAPI